jgi:uncharacterized protein DUF5667
MPRPGPDRLHDELDALLDGRPVELTGELAPLVEAAGALRAELATLQLDPEVADRHLEQVLQGSAKVVHMPVRTQPNGWDLRRRVAAVALAAALVLAPATMASAAALPGQAMYPFKRAIEQLRLVAVQWSPGGEAAERTRVAHERLDELQQLTKLRLYARLPTAIEALEEAVLAARVAVKEAREEGAAVSGVAAKLAQVNNTGAEVLQKVAAEVDQALVPETTREAIQAAVEGSKDVLEVPDRQVSGTKPATPTTAGTASTQPSASTPASTPTQPSGTNPTTPQPTAPPATPAPTLPPTTQPTATPTTAPPVTEPTPPPASGDQPAPDGRSTEQAPETTVLGD